LAGCGIGFGFRTYNGSRMRGAITIKKMLFLKSEE
jgi:hypothetical protein